MNPAPDSRRLTTPTDLIEAGLAAPERLAEMEAVAGRYAVALTPALAGLIRRGDPADPIGRQFIPDARELERDPAETDDPIGDDARSPVKGLVHRYPDRVLIKLNRGVRRLLPLLLPPRADRAGVGLPQRRANSRRRSTMCASGRRSGR